LVDYPPGTGVIVRRERPHPGAQLAPIEQADGYRYSALVTDTRVEQHAVLDGSKTACDGHDTGLGRVPSRNFAIKQAGLIATPTRCCMPGGR
jgi:hypothetical protein